MGFLNLTINSAPVADGTLRLLSGTNPRRFCGERLEWPYHVSDRAKMDRIIGGAELCWLTQFVVDVGTVCEIRLAGCQPFVRLYLTTKVVQL